MIRYTSNPVVEANEERGEQAEGKTFEDRESEVMRGDCSASLVDL